MEAKLNMNMHWEEQSLTCQCKNKQPNYISDGDQDGHNENCIPLK